MNPIPFEVYGKSRILTKEEIAAEYGERATRPIPEGYRKTLPSYYRIGQQGTKPYGVFAVSEDGKRRFISSHHSIDAADAKAIMLNNGNKDESIRYVSGERNKRRKRVKAEE